MVSVRTLLKGLKDYLWIIAGSLLVAAAINVFLLPYKIAPGGVTGAATVLYYLSNGRFPVGLTMLILNIPLFIIGSKYIGGKFIIRTFFSSIFLSFIIDTTKPFTKYFAEQYLHKLEGVPATPDILLYSIYGGLLMGAGLGLVFKSGATTGGTDIVARVIIHFVPRFTIGQILLFVDAGVVIFAAIAFNSFSLALYAIVTLFISSRLIDAILEGVNFAKALFIISDESDKIAERVLIDLDRGVTALKGTGMYTKKDKEVLLCVVHRSQLPQLKEIVKSIDEKSFVVLADIREVLGEGFKMYI